MPRVLTPLFVALAACSPPAQETAMHPHDLLPLASGHDGPSRNDDKRPDGAALDGAAIAPMQEPVSAAANPLPLAEPTLSAAALGRRTLSIAFVRVGPDGYLTVTLHDGRAIVLRNVTMGPGKFCGMRASGDQYCSEYAHVASAQAGGGPTGG